jgi:hypothetical protein
MRKLLAALIKKKKALLGLDQDNDITTRQRKYRNLLAILDKLSLLPDNFLATLGERALACLR